MFDNNLDKLICPYCHKRLYIYKKIINGTGIIKCECNFYPVVRNILYLKKDNLSKKAVNYIKKEKNIKALVTLLNLRKKQLFPLILITYFDNFFIKLGFRNTIKFLSFFSQEKGWSWYLINREKIPSYYISKMASNFEKQVNFDSADLGCGIGQAIQNNTFNIDKSFANLILANLYSADLNKILICSDLERGVPFKTSILNLITCTDTFHYIQNKKLFLEDTKRCLKSSGFLSIIHTLNIIKKENILGLAPNKLIKIVRKIGFKEAYVVSNETIWEKIYQNSKTRINIKFKDTNIENCYAYNLFAKKNKFKNTNIKLPNVNNKLIEYKNDRELINYININKLIHSFNNFIFLSPHLDDAVLSSGLLLDCLQKNKKNILVLTIFTHGSKKPYSKEASKFVKKSGYKDAEKLFSDRIIEDRNALFFLNAKYQHLSHVDVVFRKTGYLNNRLLKIDILKTLKKIKFKQKTLLLAPLGVGLHPDHILINKLVKKINKPTLYWEDFPYNTNTYSIKIFFKWNFGYIKAFVLKNQNNFRKNKAIQMYKSQINVLFNKGKIINLPERYYFSSNSKISKKIFTE